jgi:hypothetical protein
MPLSSSSSPSLIIMMNIIVIKRFSCQEVRPAAKLQLKAATILPLVGLPRSKQAPIDRGHHLL